jgi:hypothetical protein
MRRRGLIGALLLVGLGVILGTTVFRDDVAQATGLAQAPTPVREQNLDGNTNIKVHEQGTANVNVTNSSLPVAPPTPVTSGGSALAVPVPASGTGTFTLGSPVTATALVIHLDAGINHVSLEVTTGGQPALFLGPADDGNGDIVLALNRPIRFDRVT